MSRALLQVHPTPIRRLLSPEPYEPVSVDLSALRSRLVQISEHYFDPATIQGQQAALEAAFQALISRWHEDTKFSSSIADMAHHSIYQTIVGLGESVVPLLLRELQVRPDYWFTALRELTGVDPVPSEDKGKLPAMTRAWIQWGKERGLI